METLVEDYLERKNAKTETEIKECIVLEKKIRRLCPYLKEYLQPQYVDESAAAGPPTNVSYKDAKKSMKKTFSINSLASYRKKKFIESGLAKITNINAEHEDLRYRILDILGNLGFEFLDSFGYTLEKDALMKDSDDTKIGLKIQILDFEVEFDVGINFF
jgi:hypothetical protein